MGSLWAELRSAVALLNALYDRLLEVQRDIRVLRQELRDARGAMPGGGFAVELREFISRLIGMEEQVRQAERDARRLRQDLRDTRGAPAGGGYYPATFDGDVWGCNSAGYPFAEVQVSDSGTGEMLADLFCDGSGHYAGSLLLDAPTLPVDLLVIAAGADAGRFALATGPTPFSLVPGHNAIFPITIPPAPDGYTHCMAACGYVPSLVVDDYTFTDADGGDTLHRSNPLGTKWTGVGVSDVPTFRDYDGTGGCVAGVHALAVSYALEFTVGAIGGSSQWAFSISYLIAKCPAGGAAFNSFWTGPTGGIYIPVTTTVTVGAIGDDPCDGSPIVIDVPTTDHGLTIPGGGGLYSFIP